MRSRKSSSFTAPRGEARSCSSTAFSLWTPPPATPQPINQPINRSSNQPIRRQGVSVESGPQAMQARSIPRHASLRLASRSCIARSCFRETGSSNEPNCQTADGLVVVGGSQRQADASSANYTHCGERCVRRVDGVQKGQLWAWRHAAWSKRVRGQRWVRCHGLGS